MLRWLSILLALSGAAETAPINLEWNLVVDSRLTGYELGWGSVSGEYAQYQPSTETAATIDLAPPGPWHIAVRAIGQDSGGVLRSAWSDEVQWSGEPEGPTQPVAQSGLWARWSRIEQEPIEMTVEQTANASGADVLSQAVSFSTTPTTGRLAVVLVRISNNFGAFVNSFGVSDNQGNTYTERAASSGYANSTRVYTAPISTSSGTFTVAGTFDVGGNTWATSVISIVIAEVSGANNSDPVDEAGNATGTGTSWSVALSTMSADTTVFTICGNTWDATASASGWTTLVAGTESGWGAFYRVGDYDPSGTWHVSDTWACAALGVNAAAGAVAAGLPVVQYYYNHQR